MDLLLADSWKLIAKVEPGQAASASPPPGGQRSRWCRRDGSADRRRVRGRSSAPCETMQVQMIDGAGGGMTVLDIRSIVLSAPRRGSLNPLPPLRLRGDLHDDIDCTGLDAEMARNIRYGTVP